MRRRQYFVLPDVEVALQVERELLLERIETRHMHFLAKSGTDLGELPEAGLAQKTDLIHGMELGLVAGAASGAVAGAGLLLYPTMATGFSLGVIPILAVGGAVFGLWASGMIAASAPNYRLKAFEKTMEEGHVLLMVDIPKERVEQISALIRRFHPDAEDHGVDPQIPAFP